MQTSFGVIQIRLDEEIHGITAERASDVDDYFYGARRDTVCKQMGYTEAITDSVYTKKAWDKFQFNAAST